MDLKEVTERINRLSEELEKLRPLKPEDEKRVMQKFRLDWNYNSNNIEGNTLTFGETKALLLFGITAQGKPLKDHLEIEGHNEAIEEIINVARNKEPLTEAFIRNLHKLILHEPYEIDAITPDGKPTKKWVEIGKYKTTPNHVETVTGEIFYFTSPEDTPAKMEELMKWYRENLNNKKIHPLLFAVEFHHRFIRIHPFDDGNGRIVRLLMNLLLMQKGFPPVIIKTKDKENYYNVLHIADSGNLEPFYIYVGEQLIHSLELMINAAKGEEIEEPDDVDKEIAMLKKELEKVEDIEELSSDFVKEAIKNFADIFINEIIPNLKELSEFYFYRSIYVFNIFGVGQLYEENNFIKEVDSMVLGNLKARINSSVGFSLNLINFRKPKRETFDDSFDIRISFDQKFYVISIAGSNFKLEKLYHDKLNENEIKKIIHELKRIGLERIKQNTKEK